MMREHFTREKVGAVAAAVVLGLGITACGGNSDNEHNNNKAHKLHKNGNDGVNATVYKDGTRVLWFNNSDYAPILEFCDGPDLVEETSLNGFNPDAGNDVSRSVSHPACTDGRLTKADFQLNPAAK